MKLSNCFDKLSSSDEYKVSPGKNYHCTGMSLWKILDFLLINDLDSKKANSSRNIKMSPSPEL